MGRRRERQRGKFGRAVFLAILWSILAGLPALAATPLGETEKAYWDQARTGTAHWTRVENAKEYQVRLFESGGEHVKSLTVTATTAEFSRYMRNEATYYFTVRAVPTANQKDDAAGEWVMSEELEVRDLGVIPGRWRTYREGKKYQKEDGSYVAGQWCRIVNDWYYFDNEGFALTGWQLLDSKWYYFNEAGIMQSGWLDIGESRYFLDSDGSMAVGWMEGKPGEWHYLDRDGKMLSNTEVDGYMLDESGLWIR